MSTFPNTPSRQLPSNPSLESLKNQAKQLHKSHQAGALEACLRFQKFLPQFSDSSETEIQNADLHLADAQLVIAREYGFGSWTKMKAYVASLTGTDSPESQLQHIFQAIASGETESLKTENNAHLKQKIQKAHAIQSQILASISRELPTRLTRISNDVASLLSELPLESQADSLQKIRASADLLAPQVKDFLDTAQNKESQILATIQALDSGNIETLKILHKANLDLETQILNTLDRKSVALWEI